MPHITKQIDTHNALLEVNECKVRFQINTDAKIKTICQRNICREQVYPTTNNSIL